MENLPAYVVTSQNQLYQGLERFCKNALPSYVVIQKPSNIKGLGL